MKGQSLKLLIGATSLAATIGGWAALTGQAPAQAALSPAAVVAPPPAWLSDPLPTVAPLTGGGDPSTGVAPVPTAAPLRQVSAPPAARPAPVTNTRSSR